MKRLKSFVGRRLIEAGRALDPHATSGDRIDKSSFGRLTTFPASIKAPRALTNGRRMNVYLSHLGAIQSAHFDLSGKEPVYPVSVHTTLEEFILLHSKRRPPGEELSEKAIEDCTRMYNRYAVDLQKILAEAQIEEPLLLIYGDNMQSRPFPVAVKSRPAHYGSLACMVPIGRERHFAPIAEAEAVDIPFERKADRLVWRGTNTGAFVDSPLRPLSGRAHIAKVLAEGADPRFDLGYSTFGPMNPNLSAEYLALLRDAIKPKLTYKQQLRSKYILVLEGNDTATGLKWVLNSNSVTIMPHPQYVTWVCENLLEPFVHYVPVRRDLSDLAEVVDWCDANQDLCLEIIQNAKSFVALFRDDDEQRALGGKVLKLIARRTTFSYPD